MSHKRVIVIVMDGVGIGELPDADKFNDKGAHSLLHSAEVVGGLDLPMLEKLGLGNIFLESGDSLEKIVIPGVKPARTPMGHYGKMAEKSPGKDSTYGHWELMGCLAGSPLPLFPNGFPDSIISAFEKITGRKTLGNFPASGTEIIESLGREHLETGSPIVYTSADSVFQIAAHEDIISLEELYAICAKTRELLNPIAVGRVIARPFVGTPGNFTRTKKRKDFSLAPPSETVLDILKKNKLPVLAFGKIDDLFASRGTTEIIKVSSNEDTMLKIHASMERVKSGFLFANCNDTDTAYGHRRLPREYARAIQQVDAGLETIIKEMGDEDLLIVCADHGCDPTFKRHTDHTREYTPLLAFTPRNTVGSSLGQRSTFSDVGKTVADWLGIETTIPGKSFTKPLLMNN